MKFRLAMTRFDKLCQIIKSGQLIRALLLHHVLASAEHRHVLRNKVATVIDIGANRGQFALAVRRWAPQARVISFEPLVVAATRFRKVFEGDSRVILYQAAIGPESGEATIHVSAADDSSSLLPISATQERLFPGTGQIGTETITVGRLADFVEAGDINAPALLKLDVQGFELEALRGCEDLLGQFSQVYVECSFVELYEGQALTHEVIEWLHQHSFMLSGVYNLSYDKSGKAIQADFLFSRKEGRN